jgi:outer membrane protein OmpA-like peptidoglycan-associated protein
MQTEGFGSRNPIADNSTEAGRAQNRRVALQINPIG